MSRRILLLFRRVVENLLWNLPNLGGPENLNALKETVVLIVVGHHNKAFLLLCQHKLHIILDIRARFAQVATIATHKHIRVHEDVVRP